MANRFTEDELSQLSHQQLLERLNSGGLVVSGWEAVEAAVEDIRYIEDEMYVLANPDEFDREAIDAARREITAGIAAARRFADLAEVELRKPQAYPADDDF